jgi:hypothetical protein
MTDFTIGTYLSGVSRVGETWSGYLMGDDPWTMEDEYLINVPDKGGTYILKKWAVLSTAPDLTKTYAEDLINHPDHYTQVVPGVECIDVVKHFPFAEGNAIKYIWRAGVKDSATYVQDLRKAIKNLEFAIAKHEEEN